MVVYAVVALAVVVADQLSKYVVMQNLVLYQSKEVIAGFFNLVYVTNPGAAFSILADADPSWRGAFFITISVVALTALSIAAFNIGRRNRIYRLALGLIAGGAAGNLIDRIRFGAVVDFLDFHLSGYHWPAFNVADSAICVGVALFLLIQFSDSRKPKLDETS